MVTQSPVATYLSKSCFLCSKDFLDTSATRGKTNRCGFWKQTAPYIVGYSCVSCKQKQGSKSKVLDEMLAEFAAPLRSKIIAAFASEFGVEVAWLDALFSEDPIKVSKEQKREGRRSWVNHYDKLAILLGKNDLDVTDACNRILLEQFGFGSTLFIPMSRQQFKRFRGY
jgi:hypothetical protein